MALREYEYFLAIAEETNITKAAHRLHVSQPSLTQQLKRTEEELGCKLLLRMLATEARSVFSTLPRSGKIA